MSQAASSPGERAARTVVETLRRHGHTAYFAGGCVRDRLLGVAAKDFDVATDARPDAVQDLFSRTIPVGVQFGVCLVVVDGQTVEVATFRADGRYLDGRRPATVRFTTAQEDARRRDFTINGMFYDPIADRVIDYVNGQADLASGVVRAIGNPMTRFAEDRLRLLRAVRFAARLGFTIAPSTQAAITESAATVTSVAWERIGDEVVKLLTEGGAGRGFGLLAETGLLDRILPELTGPSLEFTHTLSMLRQVDLCANPGERVALAALLLDAARDVSCGSDSRSAELASSVCRRLRRSRATWERVAFLVAHHARLLEAPQLPTAALKRLLRHEGIHGLLALASLHAAAENREPVAADFCRAKLDAYSPQDLYPPRLIDGRELLRLGFARGSQLARILREVEDAQLANRLKNRTEAVAWVVRRWRPWDDSPTPARVGSSAGEDA